MSLRDRFKRIKAKAKDGLDKGKLIRYVNRLESLFQHGDIEGILNFVKPILESEGYMVKITHGEHVLEQDWAYIVYIRKEVKENVEAENEAS